MTLRPVLRPFLASHVGFDRLFAELDTLLDKGTPAPPSFPPYNIFKEGDSYTIELAVAGFKREDIRIEHLRSENTLIVSGESKPRPSSENREIIRQAIANRSFRLSFTIADGIEVKTASLEDGILKIFLDSIQKEVEKPLLIGIN
jgi:molecular chaperone IbpA